MCVRVMCETRCTLAVTCVFFLSLQSLFASETVEELLPTVLIAIPVRNKAHSLPYFLAGLEDLDYPKKRLSLWLRSDHNADNSSTQVVAWLDHVRPLYHSVDFEFDDSQTDFTDQQTAVHWSEMRFSHVMRLRQQGLDAGRRLWADFVLMIDADVILKNPKTLQLLVNQDKTVVAPLMNVTASDNYANFWGDMDDEGYYKRSTDYFAIKERETLGCYEVAMVHSVLLINLRHGISQRLAYHPPPQNYHGPHDDIIVFAHSAKYNGVKMHILNSEFFGYVPLPMEAHNTVLEEAEQFVHIKTESIVDDTPLRRVDYLYPPPLVTHKDKLGFDQVYMINLKRRPDRMEKMVACFQEYGIDFKYVEGVDGQLLNGSYLESLNVRMLPGYSDPYHGRPLTKGEIGCFLSHYFIWLDIIENGYQKVVVFEDDIRFEPYFRRRLGYIMEEVNYLRLDWDLIYLGRKKLRWQDELYVDGSERLVYPHYSYWTLAFLLTRQGVDKLMSHDPLRNLMPIDEYIPILFDRHIEDEWKNQFSSRNLIGLSVEPLLVYPTRYTGEPGYITDTDNSEVIEFGEDGYIERNPKKRKTQKTPSKEDGQLGDGHRHGRRGDIEDLPNSKDEL